MESLFSRRGRHAPRRLVPYRAPVVVLALALLLTGLLPAGVSAAPIGGWSPTGPLPRGHINQRSVLLNNEKVLAVGGQMLGFSDAFSSMAALYDPASGTWNPTGSLDTGRSGHTLTLLGNGKVLVAGGESSNGTVKSAELYDPVTGLWSSAGMMNAERARHSAVLLANNKVLVAGGGGNGTLQTAEIYDPAMNSWTPTGSLVSARAGHTAVRLISNKVLVVGGQQDGGVLASAELYNPATATWSSTGSLTVPRFYHAMTLLANGMVLVSGGLNPFTFNSTAAVERYDPATGVWTTLPGMQTPRAVHTMTRLPSGDVLVSGGFFAGAALASAEVYSPAGNSWYLTGGMSEPRLLHSSVLLNSGKVLTMGGTFAGDEPDPEVGNSADLYDPTLAVATFALVVAATGPGAAVGWVYPHGTTVIVQATADPGATFLGWTLDGAMDGWREYQTVTMGGAHALQADFAPTPSFPDVLPGNPAREAIQELAARGIIKGYGDGRFGHADTTLRAQMAALIARAMGWNGEDHGNAFTDGEGIDPNLWHNVGTLSYYNVAHGYGDGRFGPNDTVTRAQVISFVTRAMVVKGYWQLVPDDPALFLDVPATSGHRQDLVTYRHYAGYLPDQQDAAYPFADWNAPSTRGWFAQALWKALDRYFGGDGPL
jgi:hypothetical protein